MNLLTRMIDAIDEQINTRHVEIGGLLAIKLTLLEKKDACQQILEVPTPGVGVQVSQMMEERDDKRVPVSVRDNWGAMAHNRDLRDHQT